MILRNTVPAAVLSIAFLCTGPLPSIHGGGRDWPALVAQRTGNQPVKPGAVICIGSSHMENWKSVAHDLAPLAIHNFGVGGSTMRDAADDFIPNLALPYKPRAVLLYEGSNDIEGGVKPAEVLGSFRKICGETPGIRIYVLGIVPSPGKRFEKWQEIKETNALLKDECATDPRLQFIDTTSPLISAEGAPKTDCFIKGDIHMNASGYKVWAEVIAPVLLKTEGLLE